MNKPSLKNTNQFCIVLGIISIFTFISSQGFSQSMMNVGGGSTAYVNQGGGNASTNSPTFSGTATFSNIVVNGSGTFNDSVRVSGNFVSTNGVFGGVTNYLSMIDLYATTNLDNNWLNLRNLSGVSVGRLRVGAGNGIQLITGGSSADIALNDTSGTISFLGGTYIGSTTQWTVAGTVTEVHNGINNFSSNVTINANTTIGDGAGRTVTFNANTATVVGQLNFNANTFSITNGSVLLGAATPPANLVAKMYVNGNIRADNYFYNILSPVYSVTGTNSIDFSTNMIVNITGVTAGLTLTSANLLAGRSASIIFQGTTSNITLTLPTGWVPLSPTFSSVVTNKMVAIHALALGSSDSTVVYSISQQP